MKHLIPSSFRAIAATLCLAFMVSPAFAGGKYSKETADFYKAQYDVFEGKRIELTVTHIVPFDYKSNIPELRFYHAFTYDRDQRIPGGWIVIAVPKEMETVLVRRYGTAPNFIYGNISTEKLSGTLKADGKRFWFLDYNDMCAKLIDARRQEFMIEPAKPGDPDTKEGNHPHDRGDNGGWWKWWNGDKGGDKEGSLGTNSPSH